MLTIFLTILHVSVAVVLVLVVLLQTGKRADLAGAFGGGGSQTAFGTRGAATLLTKATTAAAVLFMITSLSLSILGSRSQDTDGGSVLESVPTEQSEEGAPAKAPDLPPLPDGEPVDETSTDEADAESADDPASE